MADPSCDHCGGLGEYLEHAEPWRRYVCHCDDACEACNGLGYIADDDEAGPWLTCSTCLGTGRTPHP